MSASNDSLLKKSVKLVIPAKARSWMRSLQIHIKSEAESQRKRRVELWEREFIKNGHVIHKIAPKVKMKLYSDSMLSRIIYSNLFEVDERDFMLNFLRPGDVYVDVGANVGFFTLIAAGTVGPKGRVISFEPVAKTNRRLSENILLNQFSNVQVQQCALSDCEGDFNMMVAEDEMDAFNSFARPHKGENYIAQTVHTTTWNHFATKNLLSGLVTLMKIDVEGWEAKVLTGSSEQLCRADAPVLQVEFTDEAAIAAGSTCRENYLLIESFGYKLYSYNKSTRTLELDPLRDSYPYLNLYAVKDIASVQSRLSATTR